MKKNKRFASTLDSLAKLNSSSFKFLLEIALTMKKLLKYSRILNTSKVLRIYLKKSLKTFWLNLKFDVLELDLYDYKLYF